MTEHCGSEQGCPPRWLYFHVYWGTPLPSTVSFYRTVVQWHLASRCSLLCFAILYYTCLLLNIVFVMLRRPSPVSGLNTLDGLMATYIVHHLRAYTITLFIICHVLVECLLFSIQFNLCFHNPTLSGILTYCLDFFLSSCTCLALSL